MPEKLKNQNISELNKRLRQLDDQRKESSKSQYNAKKDLVRLLVELDSLRGQKELIQREKAKEETWWQYVCSLTSGKAAEFTRARQLRDHNIVDLIGKQRTKELNVDRKLAEVQALEEKLRSISFAENRFRAEAKKIEDEWRELKSLQGMERTLADWGKRREQAGWAQPSTRTYFTSENGYRDQGDKWDYWKWA